MQKHEACVWCNAPVRVPDNFDYRKNDVVCSPEHIRLELAFRREFSDEDLGLRLYRDTGINPNHRGKGHAKGNQSSTKTPEGKAKP